MNLQSHPYFETWPDPESGVESYILNERVAPVQQSFYFTNPGVSADGKWLWLYTAFPPNRQRSLAAVSLDPQRPVIKHFPQAGFTCASPMVAPEGDAAYFCMATSVYTIAVSGEVTEICTVPAEYIGKRNCNQIATHLTMSADGTYFLLDGDLGNFWWVGLANIETGEVTILKEFGNHHNHGLFSTTDPELFLIPEDWWHDKISGRHFKYNHRIWLMDINQTRFENIRPREWDAGITASASHEWWSQDGFICWNDYEKGAHECNVETLEAVNVWQRPLCHAHCSSDRTLWCADESPYKWKDKPLEVLFYDRAADKEIHIVTAMPQPPIERSMYHLDPHPQFSPDDQWICYTTQVRGKVDVALTPVPLLKEHLDRI